MRYLVWMIVTLSALYLLTAYVVLPWLWSHYEHQPGLADRPMATRTEQGIPADPLNIGLIGSRQAVTRAMSSAGWVAADPITLETSAQIAVSVILDRPYPNAPVSNLFYDGRKQDLAFERTVGESADRRHHIRYWLVLPKGREGREVWLGSASFDVGVGLSHDTAQITHHIDPDLDAERDYAIATLSNAGALDAIYQVSGVGPTLSGRNGGGDPYFTDGEITVGVIDQRLELQSAPDSTHSPTVLPNPPSITLKGRVWSVIVALGRFLKWLPEPRKVARDVPAEHR
jgi:hypothetical protein